MQRLGDTPAFKERTLIVKGADIATQYGWTAVPNFILDEKRLSVGAKLTYAMLLKYAREQDQCFPGQKRLGEDMGAGERSVRRWLKELEQCGLIDVKQRGLNKSNLYTIHVKAVFRRKKQ